MPGFNIKGMSAAMADNRIENFKKSYGTNSSGDFKFKPMYWSTLTDGVYKLRLAPKHPSKCPSGYVRLCTHKIEVRVGEKPQEVTCTYRPDQSDSECYICDVMEAVQEELGGFRKDIQAALQLMAPRQMFIFPGIITAKADPAFVPTYNKKYAPWVPDLQSRQGCILQLEGKRVMTALFDALQQYPDCNDTDEGHWIQITKMGKESPIFRVDRQATQLTSAEAELMGDKDYPALHPLPRYMSKSVSELDYAGQKALVAQAWWAFEVIAEDAPSSFNPDEDIPF